MPTLDLAAHAGLIVIVVLAALFGLLVYLRDPVHAAPHTVSRAVRCPRRGRTAVVEFNERVQTGFAVRQVRQCPLRHEGEDCGEGCVWEPVVSP
jgi:hypothetical protein